MKPETLSIALACVNDIASQLARGDAVLASESRRTLNDLCCQYDPDTGGFTYPAVIRAALRAAGLRETA
jgi:hypothetical protein